MLVPTDGPKEEIVQLEQWFHLINNIMPLKKLTSELNQCHGHGAEFKATCMYVIGYLLCPIADHGVKREILHVVKDVNALAGYNWAQFVLHSLASGIHQYRALNLTYMSGCVFFLMILLFEHVNT